MTNKNAGIAGKYHKIINTERHEFHEIYTI